MRYLKYFNRRKNFILLQSLLYLILICLAFLSPQKGYEISIYLSTPISFWIIILIYFIYNIYFIFCNLSYKDNNWKIGFIYLFMLNILIINLSNLRSYFLIFGNSDAGSYYGYSLDLLKYGKFGENFYPNLFIINTILSLFTNINLLSFLKFIPTIFYFIYFIFIYYWSKNIYNNQKFIFIFLLISSPILFFFFFYYILSYVFITFTLTIYILFNY